MKIIILLIPFIFFGGIKNQITKKDYLSVNKIDSAWSLKMANTFMTRNPEDISYSPDKTDWNYEQGLMLYALWKLYKKTGEEKYLSYIKKNLDKYITEDGDIKTYEMKKFRLDDITPGRVVLDLYKITKKEKYKKAAELLRSQLKQQPRTQDGGFWHKKIYTEQMWLDGLYMAEPFYTQYASMFNESNDFNDIAHQFILMAEHARDPKTGLFSHGWDSSKKQKWADSLTGDSPNFWGRAIGWYLMGIVDVLDYFPKDLPQREKLISILQDLSSSVLKYKDSKTNLWYQVIDQGSRDGNYLEATASSMFMYVFAKGAAKGYLDKKYFKISEEVYHGIINNLIIEDADGMPSLMQCCSVGGLGGNPYRDGSFEYYVNEPVRKNDFKGLGPFILGALQIESDSE